MGDDYEYVSYKSPKTIVAETVYHFFRGGLYGAAFGMVGSPSEVHELLHSPVFPFSNSIALTTFSLHQSFLQGYTILRSWDTRGDSGSQNGYIPTGTRLWKLVERSLQRIDIRVFTSSSAIYVQDDRIFKGQTRSMERCCGLSCSISVLPDLLDETRRLAQPSCRRIAIGVHRLCKCALNQAILEYFQLKQCTAICIGRG